MAELEDMHPPVRETGMIPLFIYLSLGPLLWAAHTTIAYGAHTILCARGGSPMTGTIALAVLTLLFLAALGLILVRQRRVGRIFSLADDAAGRRSYDGIARLLGGLSLLAILWSGTAIALLSSCS